MLIVALFCMTTINAQTVNEQMQSINTLVEKLSKSLEKAPKDCGVEGIDTYVNGCKTAATGAVATAAQLKGLYSRQIGETQDGVTDVTVKKPSLQDWVALGTTLATQTAGIAKVGAAAANAANAVKEAPKMKAIGMAKSVKWSADALSLTGKALAEQAKAVKEIIDVLKSGNNL